jgi:hypothetical protein
MEVDESGPRLMQEFGGEGFEFLLLPIQSQDRVEISIEGVVKWFA